MSLENEIRLTREPEARVLEVGEHGFGALVGWRIGHGGGIRLGRGIGFCCQGCVRLLRQCRECHTDGGGSPEDKRQPARAETRELGWPSHSKDALNSVSKIQPRDIERK